MKYYLVKMVTNTQGQDGSTISVYNEKDEALVAYHRTLTNFHNADDVYFATVEILNERGNFEALEIVNHIPEPKPEPVTIVSIDVDGNTYTVRYSDGTVEVFEKTEQPEPEESAEE